MRRSIVFFLVLWLSSASAQVPGEPDPSFGEDGYAYTSFAGTRDVEITDAQSMIVLSAPLGVAPYGMQRFTVNGVLDPSFAVGGTMMLSDTLVAEAIVLDAEGRIVIVGSVYSQDEDPIGRFIARMLPDGLFDMTFGEDGFVHLLNDGTTVWSGFREVAVLPDDHIIAVGSSLGADAVERGILQLIDPNGALVTSFGTGGMALVEIGAMDTPLASVVPAADGRILVGGSSSAEASPFLMRFLGDGTPDPGFGTDGVFLLSAVVPDLLEGDLAVVRTLNNGSAVAVCSGELSMDGMDQSGSIVFKVDAQGELDPGYGESGIAFVPRPSVIACTNLRVLPNGGTIHTCSMSNQGPGPFTYTSQALLHHGPDGAFDTGLGNAGFLFLGYGQAAAFSDMELVPGGLVFGGYVMPELPEVLGVVMKLIGPYLSVASIDESPLRPGLKATGTLQTSGNEVLVDLPCPSVVSIDLVDMLGSRWPVMTNTSLPTGHSRVRFDVPASLAAGAYIVELRALGGRATALCIH